MVGKRESSSSFLPRSNMIESHLLISFASLLNLDQHSLAISRALSRQ